ncbi:MAG: hypothetical protein GX121_02020 [Ignavibacteria bacterium]|jgi:hypothetical protein|nr:hypothetical protein [Ignavibacteria bacterium]
MKKELKISEIGKFINIFELFFKKIDELEILPAEILMDLKFLNCDYINNCINPQEISSNLDLILEDFSFDELSGLV